MKSLLLPNSSQYPMNMGVLCMTSNKYNAYRVTTEHGVSRNMLGESAAQIRKDFEVALTGVGIEKIENGFLI